MEFFRELSRIGAGFNKITLTIAEKDGKMTIAFIPETKKEDVNRKLIPVTMTGTPMEVDEGFFPNIIAAVEKVTGLVTNMEQVEQTIKTAQEEQKKDGEEKKDKSTSKAKPSPKPAKKAAAKPVKKAIKKKEEEKTGPNSESDKHHQADLEETLQEPEEKKPAVGALGF